MNNKQNLHTHTTYGDGKNSPEEIVLEAIAKGFDSIGFSEHSDGPDLIGSEEKVAENLKRYQAEIYRLKEKYRGTIDVFCGIELELFSDFDARGFDYLIGSVHCLNIGGKVLDFDSKLLQTLAYIADNFGGDAMAFAKKYFATVATLPERAKIDILGHFDLLAKNNEKGGFLNTTSKEYLSAGYEAIHALKGKIPFFEVNTGAIGRGYRTSPYPQMEFLKEFQKCGFGAVITSDCHNKTYLDCCYDAATALLAEAGFKSKWILTDDGFREVGL